MLALLFPIAGLFFCTAFQTRLDNRLPDFYRKILGRIQALFNADKKDTLETSFLTYLVASIRAGISLDSALESAGQDSSFTPLRSRIQLILQGRPPRDFLSLFLHEALRTGIPVLQPLISFQKILQTERRVRLKAASLTSQSRAQGEVLSWLPWILLGALAVIDAEWFATAIKSSSSWFIWAIALLLVASGRHWMKRLLTRALTPSGNEEILQEVLLPELTLRLISQLSLGIDAESALEACLEKMGNKKLTTQVHKKEGRSVSAFVNLIAHALRTGAPLREDLEAYLADLQLQTESRWEERVQRLPVVMMAPLFLCFFPASLLVLVALLLPLLAAGL